jgi:hypothetical protein
LVSLTRSRKILLAPGARGRMIRQSTGVLVDLHERWG